MSTIEQIMPHMYKYRICCLVTVDKISEMWCNRKPDEQEWFAKQYIHIMSKTLKFYEEGKNKIKGNFPYFFLNSPLDK